MRLGWPALLLALGIKSRPGTHEASTQPGTHEASTQPLSHTHPLCQTLDKPLLLLISMAAICDHKGPHLSIPPWRNGMQA